MAWPRLAEYFARFKLSLDMPCNLEVRAPTLSRVPLFVGPATVPNLPAAPVPQSPKKKKKKTNKTSKKKKQPQSTKEKDDEDIFGDNLDSDSDVDGGGEQETEPDPEQSDSSSEEEDDDRRRKIKSRQHSQQRALGHLEGHPALSRTSGGVDECRPCGRTDSRQECQRPRQKARQK